MKRQYEFLKDLSHNFSGEARLYRVDPPAEYLESEEQSRLTPYIVASATLVPMHGPQVFIFPADEKGDLLEWGEIGGRKGTLDIDLVMREWTETTEG